MKRAKKSKPKTFAGRVKDEVKKISLQIEGVFTDEPKDLVAAIKQDHDSLRNYLGVLKDTDKGMAERRRAYAAFSSLLKSHSHAEELAVYVPTMKLDGREMHVKTAEGYVEHHVANDLMTRMERTKDALTWSAHANVLSESVEHHLKEEERDLLPAIRRAASSEGNQAMLEKFLNLRKKTQKTKSKKNAGVLKRA